MPDEQHTDRTATALAALRQALEDPIVEVRREAALALGHLGDVTALDQEIRSTRRLCLRPFCTPA